ncbi:cytochrome d ubiquinol oxidase subunit I [Aeromicrobium sp. SORGH_AS981]|uniref:cytochrome ubiquinol oxidase subunit I n=1 Tax=Aeromicrobium sp. SORGH_AS_0981 TaxID=3041802 RepID=UPI002855DF1D|nr:cytochrome ubiquinol oxidase subunit I [Aeromicrobium sp. SORGH_AS_0981]MDR6119860.1 cytochrome d ubiquinol oxidase subunit I [Aeromicrobium sp. SORGH_AS_0981]
MEALDIARWQFGITTVYHFFFVPVTIGLVFLVAMLQTAWHRTGNEKYLRLTRFYGKLFLINFALGIATGIVQEFQFGMNWSDYSRFVGDVFGAPLAIEGLLAFFLESTFLGLWIFGWDRLRPAVHLACIWLAAIGTVLSAYFILAANSFMQNPVGYRMDEESGRAELTDFWAVMTNKVVLVTFPHTIFACFMVGGAVVAGVGLWQMLRGPRRDDEEEREAFRTAVRLGAVVLLVAGAGTMVSGDFQGKVMTEVQPMKMAAAEGLYEDEAPASFSLLTVGTLDGSEPLFEVKIPRLLSFLGTGTWDGEVRGIDSLQEEYEQRFGPGDYAPNIPVTYWTFRAMITAGGLAMVGGAWLLWATRRRRLPSLATWEGRWLLRTAVVLPFLPLVASSFGWIFTEMGRQPWVVFGLMETSAGVSPGVSAGEALTTLVGFTALYAALAVVEFRLLLTYIRKGLPDADPPELVDDPDAPLAFAY